jgi:hypothetical protein
MYNQKGNTLIIVVCLVIVGGLLGLYYLSKGFDLRESSNTYQKVVTTPFPSQSPQQNTIVLNCSTNTLYKNAILGFQVTCPISFVISFNNYEKNGFSLVGFSSKDLHPNEAKDYSDIVIKPMDKLNNTQTLGEFILWESNDYYSIKDTVPYVNGNINGVVYTWPTKEQRVIFVEHDGRVYEFILQGPANKPYSENALKIFDTLLSSFKFTN